MFYALYSPEIPLKNTTNPYAFFIDLEKLPEDNIEDAVFSWSKQWREYKALLDGVGKYNLEKLKREKLLPLTFLSNDSEFWKLWFQEYRALFAEDKAQEIENYMKNIIDYQIHVLSIPLT